MERVLSVCGSHATLCTEPVGLGHSTILPPRSISSPPKRVMMEHLPRLLTVWPRDAMHGSLICESDALTLGAFQVTGHELGRRYFQIYGGDGFRRAIPMPLPKRRARTCRRSFNEMAEDFAEMFESSEDRDRRPEGCNSGAFRGRWRSDDFARNVH
ncbi:hypothetical protein BMG00_15620 [Thioclava marina]|uniref:Uncharacterized protein n=1 Tax=Thioclava marina TaxID=1915077 RepID=A0ABX3MIH3_9RHOB|nr:hypothetical protein BMG00_15620 [Thioclava marina]